jgi:hypothetical protein
MSVEPSDRAAPKQKALHLLADAEKAEIIQLQKSEYSWATINSILKRPPSSCRIFSEKLEQT